jgi:hypothetical protein
MAHNIRLPAFLVFSGVVWAQDVTQLLPSLDPVNLTPIEVVPVPIATSTPKNIEPQGVRWGSLFSQSLRFLAIEHAFRYATEAGTRHPGLPFFRGYIDSVGALHGWADGDPFYVNYVGHPMQGAVAGYLWTLNDTRFRFVEFGRNPEYWKSRIRAGAFAWAYSVQLEIGPISEASIGNVQASFPQQGLVDHVVTPAIGLGWMIAEDALDQYLVRFVERKTQNRYLRALVRGGANPSRSFANAISGQWPWARPRDEHSESMGALVSAPLKKVQDQELPRGVAPFEFVANAYAFAAPSGTCAGGGASAAFRVSTEWQMVLDVNGCKMTGLEKNLTGDSLTYMAGPRWTPSASRRLVPYAQVLLGGNKLTQELMLPEKKQALEQLVKDADSKVLDHGQYTREFELDGFAMSAGVGLDMRLNRALAIRLVGLDYMHSWVTNLNGYAPNGLQFKTGVVLRMGTW